MTTSLMTEPKNRARRLGASLAMTAVLCGAIGAGATGAQAAPINPVSAPAVSAAVAFASESGVSMAKTIRDVTDTLEVEGNE